ncbi:hypothetical protein WJX77_004012 [Trebouxia sp. C0004]
MNRARKMTITTLHCSAKSGPQPEPSLLHDVTQGLRMSYEMLDSKTKAVALQKRSLLAERRQDAAYIKELRETHAELTTTVAKQAANIAEHAAPTDCQASTHNSIAQGLPLSSHTLDAKLKEAALQNSTLMAGRRHDAVCLQQLVDTDSQLRTTVAQQAAMIAEQAEAIDRQKKVLAHSERHVSIISRLLSKLQGRCKVQASELDHIASDSHVELLVEEKQGLQKTLEETEDELAKERQRSEYARGEAQHRATKRQELQEARDHEEHLKHQMHAKWVQALKEVEMLKEVMIYGHFLFEALMKVPLQAGVSTNAHEQAPALEEEDLYV